MYSNAKVQGNRNRFLPATSTTHTHTQLRRKGETIGRMRKIERRN
jgi:hypothetical protein